MRWKKKSESIKVSNFSLFSVILKVYNTARHSVLPFNRFHGSKVNDYILLIDPFGSNNFILVLPFSIN